MPGWFGFEGLGGPDLDPPFDITTQIGGVTFDDNDLMVLIVVPLLLGGLAWFLRATRVGIAIRGVAERSDRASTLGVPVGRIQTTVWVITTVLAFATVFLRAGVISVPIGSALGITVLVRALAAAVIGRMESFPRITAAALGLGVVEQAIVYDTGRDIYIFPVIFVIIVVAVALNRRQRGNRVDDDIVSTWQAVREIRPVPAELRGCPRCGSPARSSTAPSPRCSSRCRCCCRPESSPSPPTRRSSRPSRSRSCSSRAGPAT